MRGRPHFLYASALPNQYLKSHDSLAMDLVCDQYDVARGRLARFAKIEIRSIAASNVRDE